MCNVPIKMSDGVVLRANLWLPSPAAGAYPTVLTATGYNKDTTNPTGTACSGSGGIAMADTALADRGYAVMMLDDRGTGASQGKWDSWGQRTQDDYSEVLDWIQAQGWSDGSVATTGGSYMGITSLLIAEADAARVSSGKPRAVKAVWADVPMSDAYRDVTFHGGAVDAGFIPLWLGLDHEPLEPAAVHHARRSGRLRAHLGRPPPERAGTSPGRSIVELDARRGERLRRPLLPAALARRPRRPDRDPGGGPGRLVGHLPARRAAALRAAHGLAEQEAVHVAALPHRQRSGDSRTRISSNKWFDHWLQGARQRRGEHAVGEPVSDRRRPLGAPLDLAAARRPLHAGLPGRREIAQLVPLPAEGGGDNGAAPASIEPVLAYDNAVDGGLAPGARARPTTARWEASSLTYTSEPLEADTKFTGPLVANVWAELTSKDATLVSVLSDVAPSGESNQVTAGFLLASQRAVDPARSTFDANGTMIRPFHPFTRESQQPVTPERPGALPDRDLPDLGDLPEGRPHPADDRLGRHAGHLTNGSGARRQPGRRDPSPARRTLRIARSTAVCARLAAPERG